MSSKVCLSCYLDLPIDRFLPSAHSPDGVTETCRDCVFARARRDRDQRDRRTQELTQPARGQHARIA